MKSTDLTILQKDAIHRSVEKRMLKWYGHKPATSGMACLYFMQVGMVTLKQHGIDCWPAAGTAHFQIQVDDGKMTHFSFEWNGDPNSELRRQAALTEHQISLPEMHCWIWIPATEEVVDFSTGHVPKLASVLGYEWKVTPPPPYIWSRVQSLYPRAIYIPNRDATKLAIQTLAAHKGTIQ